ncbi:hypothetical protein MKW92_024090 [Papaver armeniacum]|nr:hypothetical protein MKW92_024090 [Papaver armeniacum]
MDLDDIEYLEKGVEDPENSKAENQSSGGGKREGEKSYRSSRRRAEDDENGADEDDERVTDNVEKEAVKEVVRGKSRDREIREAREKEREQRDNETREREREMSRRFKDKKENMEPEADPERDQRTVFAYQMPLKATERDVYEFFSKAGK